MENSQVIKYRIGKSRYGDMYTSVILNIVKETPKQYKTKHDTINKSKCDVVEERYGDYIYIDTKGMHEDEVKLLLSEKVDAKIDKVKERFEEDMKMLEDMKSKLKPIL